MTVSSPAEGLSPKPLLTISIVTYQPDIPVLRKTFETLERALRHFDSQSVRIFIIQNSEHDAVRRAAAEAMNGYPYELISGHGNIGFGRAHNLVLQRTGHFHLVLNPDIEMEHTALSYATEFLLTNPDCGLLTPEAKGLDGERQYLCKQYPPLFDLLLRGFAPKFIKSLFSERLARYEMRRETSESIFWDPPIVSGCFMFFRGDVFRNVNGFDPDYFLYFEDFDLSLRTAQIARIAYVPHVKISHAGGHAARKGLWHIKLFVKSAKIFYKKHGLRII
ncbi:MULTISPECIES: glycosyltransferase family 2 protein [unclassified Pannonibacter]|uniref:glycosyltransferase family 2 protein n=1 Tax=unclassified Pannonibacter TaxID=2627228 RepID=UPI001648AB5B|nr:MULTISPECIES: glycosyltransferase family 2 protein [unclassified Pannonibacter]